MSKDLGKEPLGDGGYSSEPPSIGNLRPETERLPSHLCKYSCLFSLGSTPATTGSPLSHLQIALFVLNRYIYIYICYEDLFMSGSGY